MGPPALLRVVERELLVFRRLWRTSLGSAFLSPLLFLAAMGIGLGGMVDERTGDVDGLPYLAFVAPGLLAASAMQLAAGESLWRILAGLRWMGSFKAMVATPVGPGDVYGGAVAWTCARAGMSAAAFLAVAALLGAVPSPWAVLALPATVLCAAAFAAPLTAYTATQESDASFPVILRFGIVPLFLFSGTFFPVGELPGWLRPAVALSPLWHGVELCRAATTGTAGGGAVAHVAVLAAVTAAGWRWGTRTFARRLTQ